MGDDVIRMQQEAAHRVQQMQERTRRRKKLTKNRWR